VKVSDSKAIGIFLAGTRTGRGAFECANRSQGVESWRYSFGADVTQVPNFRLQVATNFENVDFPDNTLSPTEKRRTGNGWTLTWAYGSLLSGFQIGITMPERLQPARLRHGSASLRRCRSSSSSSSCSSSPHSEASTAPMTTSFSRPRSSRFTCCWLTSWTMFPSMLHSCCRRSYQSSSWSATCVLQSECRFAAVEAGLTQFCFLVLFSYAFFFEGYTGLSITVGAIVTLFVVMQMTGRSAGLRSLPR